MPLVAERGGDTDRGGRWRADCEVGQAWIEWSHDPRNAANREGLRVSSSKVVVGIGLLLLLLSGMGLASAFITLPVAKKRTWQEVAPSFGFPGDVPSDDQARVQGLAVEARTLPFLVRVEIRTEFLDVESDRLLKSDLYIALFGYTKRIRSRSALDEPPAKKADTS